jgi:hypothetical protein
LLAKKRTPPLLSEVKLPLRTKEEFLAALETGRLNAALLPALRALDLERRAGTLAQRSKPEIICASNS